MSSISLRTLFLATATALVVAAPAWGAANVGLTVQSATSDAITYRVASPQPGEYVARFSTGLLGSGPRAVFRFSDHDAQGRHTWTGLFKPGRRGLKLCLGQSAGGQLVAVPSWDQVCSACSSPRKRSKPLADALKVRVKRRKVVLRTLLAPLAGKFARVTLIIRKNPEAGGRPTRRASRGVKLKKGRTTYKPDLRPKETLRAATIKVEDEYHRYAGTVTR